MITQGFVHLLTGFDHLAFLLVALLGVARQRNAHETGTSRAAASSSPSPLRATFMESLKVITAFTVAHSITLTLAATSVVVFASQPVEAAIAGTVALTAISGFWKPTRLHGWPLAFAFGLVHGFGFASALAETLGGAARAATTLVAFNLGIELAQIAVALALVPALYWLARQRSFDRLIAPAISAVVAGVAMVWLFERAL